MSSLKARKDQRSNTKVPDLVPPDGGWAWLVAIGAFTSTLLIPFGVQSFAIMFSKLFDDNNTSTFTISWIFNMCQVTWGLSSIFLPLLCRKFGCRRVVFLGGLILGTSLIMTSFLEKAEYLFLSYSFLYGCGASCGVTVWQIIIPQYFEKRKGRVIGVVTCGLCSGQFISPLLARTLQEAYGHRSTILIMGALLLNVCVAGALYQPVEWHAKILNTDAQTDDYIVETEEGSKGNPKEPFVPHTAIPKSFWSRRGSDVSRTASLSEVYASSLSLSFSAQEIQQAIPDFLDQENKDSTADKASLGSRLYAIFKLIFSDIYILRNTRALIVCFGNALTIMLYVNMIVFIPLFVKDKGYTPDFAAYCLTVLGICNTTIRIIVSSLTDLLSFHPKWYFMCGTLVLSASILTFSMAADKTTMLIAMGTYGIGIGSCVCLFVQLMITTLGKEAVPSAVGGFGFLQLCLSLCFGPLLGCIRDLTGDFGLCLKLIAAMELIPFFLWLLMPIAIKLDSKRETNNYH